MIGRSSIPNKKTGEEIVIHLRRHWFIFFNIFLFFTVLFLIPVVIYYFFAADLPGIYNRPIVYPLALIGVFTYYLITLVFAFTFWTTTYLDVWTITTERIINREQNGLFNRVVSELDLYRVQDVTAEQKGFFATIFHYGNVYIQSAGEKERFVFEQVPNPYSVAKMIQRLDEKSKLNHVQQ